MIVGCNQIEQTRLIAQVRLRATAETMTTHGSGLHEHVFKGRNQVTSEWGRGYVRDVTKVRTQCSGPRSSPERLVIKPNLEHNGVESVWRPEIMRALVSG